MKNHLGKCKSRSGAAAILRNANTIHVFPLKSALDALKLELNQVII